MIASFEIYNTTIVYLFVYVQFESGVIRLLDTSQMDKEEEIGPHVVIVFHMILKTL